MPNDAADLVLVALRKAALLSHWIPGIENRVLELVLDLAATYAAEEVALAVNGWPAGD